MRQTLKEHGKEPGCNLSANSRASHCRAGWPKTVCYFCVLFSVQINLSMLFCIQTGSLDTQPTSLWWAKGASPQVPAPGSLWGIKHIVGSGFILEDALCIHDTVVPQEPKAGGKLPLHSSILLNRNLQPLLGHCIQRCPFVFKTKFCMDLYSKGNIFCYLGIFLISALERQQLEQAEEIEKHRASTLPERLPEQWGSPRVGQALRRSREGELLPSVPAQAPCKLASQALPTRQSHLRYRLGVLCQIPQQTSAPQNSAPTRGNYLIF